MWGIGYRLERHFNDLGMFSIEDIAHYDKSKLKKRFGIIGEEIWYHCHGIDMSMIKDKARLRIKAKSFGISQVLFKDYNEQNIQTIILEMVDDVTRRLRLAKKRAKTISLSIGYSKHIGGGFSHQLSLSQPTVHETVVYKVCLELFDAYYLGYPIRKVGLFLSNLDDNNYYQYSLFEDVETLNKEYRLQSSLDTIKHRYGKNAITRAVSEEDHATAKKRNQQMGGHHV